MDDVLGKSGVWAKLLYFAASYCVLGFFLLSGFLLGTRESITIEYCEGKVYSTIKKLFGWVVFWVAVHFLRTGEMADLWDNIISGAYSEGILPVAWFLYTYCFLMILTYPMWNLLQKFPKVFVAASILWGICLAFDVGRVLLNTRCQSLWLHLYIGYFAIGMAVAKISEWVKSKGFEKISYFAAWMLFIVSATIYACNILNAEVFIAPHNYYGTWYYSLWLISGLWLCKSFRIKSERLQTCFKLLSTNTFVVYLGHLPILLYITEKNLWKQRGWQDCIL